MAAEPIPLGRWFLASLPERLDLGPRTLPMEAARLRVRSWVLGLSIAQSWAIVRAHLLRSSLLRTTIPL